MLDVSAKHPAEAETPPAETAWQAKGYRPLSQPVNIFARSFGSFGSPYKIATHPVSHLMPQSAPPIQRRRMLHCVANQR